MAQTSSIPAHRLRGSPREVPGSVRALKLATPGLGAKGATGAPRRTEDRPMRSALHRELQSTPRLARHRHLDRSPMYSGNPITLAGAAAAPPHREGGTPASRLGAVGRRPGRKTALTETDGLRPSCAGFDPATYLASKHWHSSSLSGDFRCRTLIPPARRRVPARLPRSSQQVMWWMTARRRSSPARLSSEGWLGTQRP